MKFLHLLSYFLRKFLPSCNLRKATSNVRESWILPIGKSRTPSIYDKAGLHFMKNCADWDSAVQAYGAHIYGNILGWHGRTYQ